MRILIYGAGVIGSLYAVLLKEAGYDTTIYARGHRLEALQNQGLLYKKNNINSYYILEENGINISGGQRQRIILARSLLKNSKIIMIDEGFNQIDIKLEREILLDIFRYFHDRTFIIISHRIENSDLYNRVIKIDNGFVNMIEEVYNE